MNPNGRAFILIFVSSSVLQVRETPEQQLRSFYNTIVGN